jgi:hypothetical protein
MNWKRCERKQSWLVVIYYFGICLERQRKTTKNLSQDIWSQGIDLNVGLPQYEAGVLTTQL